MELTKEVNLFLKNIRYEKSNLFRNVRMTLTLGLNNIVFWFYKAHPMYLLFRCRTNLLSAADKTSVSSNAK